MTGRRSVWSDLRVIEFSRHFVAATDEVWRLQQGDDPECVFFQEMADHGHYGGQQGQSRQGIYVCAPNGQFLASINSNDPNRVLAMMQRGLDAWNELPPESRGLVDDSEINPRHRWETSFPSDGLVLTMITRDLPSEGPEQPQATKWNQDQVWFSKEEAREFLPDELVEGRSHELPQHIRDRLVRFHLVDTVKGQTRPFGRRDVEQAEIQVTITDVSDQTVHIEITGRTKAEGVDRGRRGSTHGVETNLLGQGIFDRRTESFQEFEILAVGDRWGRTTYNGRRRELDRSAVGFVFQKAPANLPAIAPAFLNAYNADWIVRPN